MADGAR